MTTAAPSPAPTFTLAGTWSDAALSALADILLRAAEREIAQEQAGTVAGERPELRESDQAGDDHNHGTEDKEAVA